MVKKLIRLKQSTATTDYLRYFIHKVVILVFEKTPFIKIRNRETNILPPKTPQITTTEKYGPVSTSITNYLYPVFTYQLEHVTVPQTHH